MIHLIYHLAYGLLVGWLIWRLCPRALRGE